MKMIEFPGGFPLRTLVVCFTVWLIATEVLVFDQIKFDTRTQLLEQAARGFHGPEVIVPNERPSHVPSGANMETSCTHGDHGFRGYPPGSRQGERAVSGPEVELRNRTHAQSQPPNRTIC